MAVTEAPSSFSPQYARTHKAICRALIELLNEKPFEKITVQDILDRTPVTRTTFYKHFTDKYSVAEELQAEYVRMVRNVRDTMKGHDISEYSAIAQRLSGRYYELSKALLKIHTDKVDLKEILKVNLEEKYRTVSAPILKQSTRDAALSASVYAEAIVNFEIASMMFLTPDTDTRILYNDVMIGAFLAALELEGDEHLREYLTKKVNHEI